MPDRDLLKSPSFIGSYKRLMPIYVVKYTNSGSLPAVLVHESQFTGFT